MFEQANCKLRISKCKELQQLGLESTPIERPIKLKCEVGSLEELVSQLHEAFSSSYVNVEYVQQLMMNYKSDQRHWRKFAKFDRFKYTRNLVDAGNGLFNVMVLCWGPGHASAIHDHADSHCFMKMLKGQLEEVRYEWPERSKPAILREKPSNIPCTACDRTRDDCDNGRETHAEICHNDGCHNDCCYNDSCHNVSCQRESCRSVDSCHEDYRESDRMMEIGRTRLEENDVCYINDTLGLHRVENPSHSSGAVSLHLYSPPFDACRVFDARTGRPARADVTFWSVGGKRVSKMKQEN